MKKLKGQAVKNRLFLATLGLNMAGAVGFFALIGVFLDRKYHNDGYPLTLVASFLGLVYCGYEVWKAVREVNDQPPDNEKKKREG